MEQLGLFEKLLFELRPEGGDGVRTFHQRKEQVQNLWQKTGPLVKVGTGQGGCL